MCWSYGVLCTSYHSSLTLSWVSLRRYTVSTCSDEISCVFTYFFFWIFYPPLSPIIHFVLIGGESVVRLMLGIYTFFFSPSLDWPCVSFCGGFSLDTLNCVFNSCSWFSLSWSTNIFFFIFSIKILLLGLVTIRYPYKLTNQGILMVSYASM